MQVDILLQKVDSNEFSVIFLNRLDRDVYWNLTETCNFFLIIGTKS